MYEGTLKFSYEFNLIPLSNPDLDENFRISSPSSATVLPLSNMASRFSSSSQKLQQCDSQTTLTYRQRRRIEQAQKKGGKRGPTTGKKYILKKKNNYETKTKVEFSDELRRVVGNNAEEFICDCSRWVREFCPLESINWTRMDGASKKRLLDKIKEKYDVPPIVRGKPVDKALLFQCASLYRGWRYRLKERFFVPHSKIQSRLNRPPEIEHETWYWLVDFWLDGKTERISSNNRKNRLGQIIRPANGARSTARILNDMLNAPPPPHTETDTDSHFEGSIVPNIEPEPEPEPVYIKLYEKTKKHKDGSWDMDAEEYYNALRKRHADEIEKNGVDHLTVQEAYIEVLKTQPGYIRGLGPGSQPPKRDRIREESREIKEELGTQIQELQQSQQASTEREVELQGVIEDLKLSNEELRATMERMWQEVLERENNLRKEALERENKMRQEFLQMLRSGQ